MCGTAFIIPPPMSWNSQFILNNQKLPCATLAPQNHQRLHSLHDTQGAAAAFQKSIDKKAEREAWAAKLESAALVQPSSTAEERGPSKRESSKDSHSKHHKKKSDKEKHHKKKSEKEKRDKQEKKDKKERKERKEREREKERVKSSSSKRKQRDGDRSSSGSSSEDGSSGSGSESDGEHRRGGRATEGHRVEEQRGTGEGQDARREEGPEHHGARHGVEGGRLDREVDESRHHHKRHDHHERA